MIGGIVLNHCLKDKNIDEVILISRRTSGISSPKIKEVITDNFLDFSASANDFKNVDVAYFCLGVYTGAVSDDLFKTITVDYTMSFAEAVKNESPNVIFSFLSGAGADLKEKSRTSFARYKGMAENFLLQKGFDELYIFRPAYIYPVEKRKEPNFMYRLYRRLYPIIKLFGKNMHIKSTDLGEAMYAVYKNKPDKIILENKAIVALVA